MIGMVGMRYFIPSLGLVAAAAFPVKTGLQHLASSLIHLHLVVVWFPLFFTSIRARLSFGFNTSDDSYVLLCLTARALDTRIPISQSKPASDIYSFAQSAVICFCFGQLM